jgi:proline iminopeptidase
VVGLLLLNEPSNLNNRLLPHLLSNMKILFPEITPFHTFWLETESTHQVYVERSGNPTGIPVIFLHGGPCSGTRPDHRRFFNPERYHIILMDQRGCGLSLPFGELQNNTTQHLIADMEAIRIQLRIEQWVLFGGSWGASLALLYAQRYPQQVRALILRGVFLARQTDMDWFLGAGVNRLYPQQWQQVREALKVSDDKQVQTAFVDAVFSNEQTQVLAAVKQWQAWGGLVAVGKAFRASEEVPTEKDILQVRMEVHYAKQHYFIRENQILDNCAELQHIPTVIIHGENDLTCPLESAWRLWQVLPQASYIVVPNAGHIAKGEEMIDALVTATEQLLSRL